MNAKIGFDTAENEPCKVCPLSVYRYYRSIITTDPVQVQLNRAGFDGQAVGSALFGLQGFEPSPDVDPLFFSSVTLSVFLSEAQLSVDLQARVSAAERVERKFVKTFLNVFKK